MITIARQIPNLTHCGNPMLIYCSTDNQLSAAGSYTRFRLDLVTSGTGLLNNETVTFTVMNQSFTFTAKTSPNNSGTELRLRAGGDTDLQYVQKLAQDLAGNYSIFSNYRIEPSTTGGTYYIALIARKKGSLYNITSFSCPSAKFTATVQVVGADFTYKPNFKLLCQVWEDGTDVTLLGEDRLTPDKDGNVEFDISGWLRGQRKATFQFPIQTALTYADITVKYFCVLGEVYGNFATPQKVFKTASKSTITGALDKSYFEQRYRQYEPYPASLETLFLTESKVLWDRPFKTYAAPYDNEKFYFVSSKKFTLKKTFYYNDSTPPLTVIIGSFPFDLDYPIGWEVSVSPWFLVNGFVSQLANIKYVRITAETPSMGTSPIFEPVEIWIDKNYYARRREFMFKNRRGVYEFVRFTGYFGRVKKYDWLDYDRADAYNNPFSIAKTAKYNVEPELEIEGNTGPLTKENLLWIREFFESPDIYENIKGRLYSVKLLTKEHNSFKDGEFEQGVNFTYVRLEEPYIASDGKCGNANPEDIYTESTKPTEHLIDG